MSQPTRLTCRTILTLIGFALLVRLFVLIIFPSVQYSFGDSSDYQKAAHALCIKLPYPDATELPFFRAPGLPIFLALATVCSPHTTTLGRLALIFTDLISVIGLISLTHLLGLKTKVQLLTALAFAISPLVVGQTLDIQSEPLFQCFTIWLTVAIFNHSKRSRFIAGLLFGAAALTRPVAIGFIPLILWGIWQITPKILVKGSLLFFFGAFLIISPWSYANFLRTGEFILINDAAGYNFWRGNHPIMAEVYNAADADTLANLSYRLEHELTPALIVGKSSLSRSEGSSYFFQQGLTQLVNNPAASFSLLVTKCWVFLRPTIHSGAWPNLIWWAIALWESLLYIFATLAFLKGPLSVRMRIGILLYLFLGLILSVPFQVVTRFRVPLYEWVLLILAATLFGSERDYQNKARTDTSSTSG